MSRLKNLIREVHRRSLWQVLAVYITASWVVLQLVDVLTDSYGMAQWFPALALALLLIGLPIVLATAIVQEGIPAIQRGDPTLIPSAADAGEPVGVASAPAEASAVRKLFTWRNAITGGVLAFSLWGVVAAAWLLFAGPGLLVKAEAADFFSAREKVVVAELENETDQEALGLAVREAIITDLDQSEYVNAVSRTEMIEVLRRMRLADTTEVDEQVALEIARREGRPAVVAGAVAPLGSGFQLSVRIIETATGEVAVRVRETAADGSEVVAAVERLSRLVRRHLGESLASIRRSQPLPDVTTASLEALEFFARAQVYADISDWEAAIPLFERAVALDTTFAAAYRALGVGYSNLGNLGAAQPNADRAYRHGERLIDRERLMTGALYHARRNRLDSAAYYYSLAYERYPDFDTPVNNLGDVYESMGRYEDALRLYQRMVEMSPQKSVGYGNVTSAARVLGMHAVAESAMAVQLELAPNSPWPRFNLATNAYYAGDFARAEEVMRGLADDPSLLLQSWGNYGLSGLVGMRGELARCLALADTAAQLATPGGTPIIIYVSALTAQQAGLAAGMPERALPYLSRALEQAETEEAPAQRYRAWGLIAQAYAFAGELETTRGLLERMDSLAAADDFHPFGIGEQVLAVLALQDDRAEESLEHLRRARAADFGLQYRTRQLLLGDAYAALGRLPEAAAQYDSMTTSALLFWQDAWNEAPLRPLAHERLGAVYLAMGDTTSAIQHLAEFAELWKNADPELQPRVQSAQSLLESLAGEKS